MFSDVTFFPVFCMRGTVIPLAILFNPQMQSGEKDHSLSDLWRQGPRNIAAGVQSRREKSVTWRVHLKGLGEFYAFFTSA